MSSEAEQIASLHKPALLRQTVEAMAPLAGGRYLDCTAGLGGHAEAILTSAPDSELCAMDRDNEALELCKKRLARFGGRVHYFNMPFARFAEALRELEWPFVNGALVDLGVSSLQLDKDARGFSFNARGPLDMRMGRDSSMTAADYVNTASFDELRNCIATCGEDPQAARIARKIIEFRQLKQFESTTELAETVISAYPAQWRRKARRHPATRTFQAIRMRINDEAGQLGIFLEKILAWLALGGRLCVISFHSLEDRMVKNSFRQWAAGCLCPPHTLVCTCGHRPEVALLTKKPVIADAGERAANPRASCAKLRAVEKIWDRQHDNS